MHTQDDELWDKIKHNIKPIKKPTFPIKPLKKVKIEAQPYKAEIKPCSFGMSYLEKGDLRTLDKATGARFSKGKLPIEAKLDLHGYTEERAFAKVTNFIEKEYNKGSCCVLIVTGRGRVLQDEFGHIEINTGLLYNQLPKWLNCPDIRGYVVSFTQAVDKDGGGGAVYVYLKNKNKDLHKNKKQPIK